MALWPQISDGDGQYGCQQDSIPLHVNPIMGNGKKEKTTILGSNNHMGLDKALEGRRGWWQCPKLTLSASSEMLFLPAPSTAVMHSRNACLFSKFSTSHTSKAITFAWTSRLWLNLHHSIWSGTWNHAQHHCWPLCSLFQGTRKYTAIVRSGYCFHGYERSSGHSACICLVWYSEFPALIILNITYAAFQQIERGKNNVVSIIYALEQSEWWTKPHTLIWVFSP